MIHRSGLARAYLCSSRSLASAVAGARLSRRLRDGYSLGYYYVVGYSQWLLQGYSGQTGPPHSLCTLPYALNLKLQPVFAKARKYLDISKRLDVLNRKMDILKARQHALFPNSIGTVACDVLHSSAARVVYA